MKKIIVIVFFTLISVHSACIKGNYSILRNGQWCMGPQNPSVTTICGNSSRDCNLSCSGEYCQNIPVKQQGSKYFTGFIGGQQYQGLCFGSVIHMGNSIYVNYEYQCDTKSQADSLDCKLKNGLWDGTKCGKPLDTLCVNIPLSVSAQIGTSARAYYVKNKDGSLTKILNEGNSDRLCGKSIEQGMGDVNIINNLTGPDGENYGTFCQGSCESAGLSNGGQISCNTFGCHESSNQGGSINPNDYGGQNSDFGAGTGGGFGSGGGSGSGVGSGVIGDSISPVDTTSTAPSWSDGCQVLNLQTCTCDGFTYVGSSNMTATIYNHNTGQTGSCSVDLVPEVATCPVDWATCDFKKTPQDTSSYAVDSLRTDSTGDWEYNYFPILTEINNSLKALDYNQNSNAKDMQNFFNNYKGTNFEGTSKRDTTIINITNRDTTIVDFPDTTIDLNFIYDSISNWNSSIDKVKDTLSSFTFFNPDSAQELEIDSVAIVNNIISTASQIIDSGKVLFPLNFQSFAGSSNCPAFMTQGREIKTYVGSSHSFNYSSVCDVRIFGKELFALIRSVLRLVVSVGCAWVIFKATVGYREG